MSEHMFPPPVAEAAERGRLSRIKRNSRIELAICLGALALATVAMAIFR